MYHKKDNKMKTSKTFKIGSVWLDTRVPEESYMTLHGDELEIIASTSDNEWHKVVLVCNRQYDKGSIASNGQTFIVSSETLGRAVEHYKTEKSRRQKMQLIIKELDSLSAQNTSE